MVSGLTIRLTDLGPTCGKMVASSTVSGYKTTCKGMEFIYTMMESGMMVLFMEIKKRVGVFTYGLMDVDMRDGGTRASSTALEYTLTKQNRASSTASGSMASV